MISSIWISPLTIILILPSPIRVWGMRWYQLISWVVRTSNFEISENFGLFNNFVNFENCMPGCFSKYIPVCRQELTRRQCSASVTRAPTPFNPLRHVCRVSPETNVKGLFVDSSYFILSFKDFFWKQIITVTDMFQIPWKNKLWTAMTMH